MKISVAMCTYNGAKHIGEQIDSILSQTLAVDEIIICDDCSSDDTLSILHKYFDKRPELFKIIKNDKNLKSVKNFEKAIGLCNGDITFLCDQDDYWHPKKVEIFIENFKHKPETYAFCSNGFLMDENSDILSDQFTKWDVYEKYLSENIDHDKFSFLIEKGNFSTGATMAVVTKFAQSTFPIPILKDFHHDEWITILAAAHGKMEFINQKLINYRIHKSQQVGEIGFLKSSSYFQQIYSYFNNYQHDDDFSSLKGRLKALTEWHNKFLVNFKSNQSQYDFLQNKFFKVFRTVSDKRFKKFPIKSVIINFIDKVLNKRQLIK